MATTLTLELPEEDVSFIQHYAKERGVSVSDSIDRIIAFLRRTEQRPIHPDVLSLVGILRDVDPESARLGYLTEKHL